MGEFFVTEEQGLVQGFERDFRNFILPIYLIDPAFVVAQRVGRDIGNYRKFRSREIDLKRAIHVANQAVSIEEDRGISG